MSHCHFLIESLRRCNYNATEIHGVISNAWPEEAPSLKRVQVLVKEFTESTRQRSNSRKSDERNIAAEQVKDTIEEDSTRTVRDIADLVDITKTTVHGILTDDLERKWTLTKWIPHILTEERKINRVLRIQDLLEKLSSRNLQNNLVMKSGFLSTIMPQKQNWMMGRSRWRYYTDS